MSAHVGLSLVPNSINSTRGWRLSCCRADQLRPPSKVYFNPSCARRRTVAQALAHCTWQRAARTPSPSLVCVRFKTVAQPLALRAHPSHKIMRKNDLPKLPSTGALGKAPTGQEAPLAESNDQFRSALPAVAAPFQPRGKAPAYAKAGMQARHTRPFRAIAGRIFARQPCERCSTPSRALAGGPSDKLVAALDLRPRVTHHLRTPLLSASETALQGHYRGSAGYHMVFGEQWRTPAPTAYQTGISG